MEKITLLEFNNIIQAGNFSVLTEKQIKNIEQTY